jgi:hypothetical protein
MKSAADRVTREASGYIFTLLQLAGTWNAASNVVIQDRVARIVGMAFDLNRTIGQQITSSEMLVMAVHSGTFDANSMDNEFADEKVTKEGAQSLGTVVGTLSLGLTKLRKRRNGAMDSKILLKPSVVLSSVGGAFGVS